MQIFSLQRRLWHMIKQYLIDKCCKKGKSLGSFCYWPGFEEMWKRENVFRNRREYVLIGWWYFLYCFCVMLEQEEHYFVWFLWFWRFVLCLARFVHLEWTVAIVAHNNYYYYRKNRFCICMFTPVTSLFLPYWVPFSKLAGNANSYWGCLYLYHFKSFQGRMCLFWWFLCKTMNLMRKMYGNVPVLWVQHNNFTRHPKPRVGKGWPWHLIHLLAYTPDPSPCIYIYIYKRMSNLGISLDFKSTNVHSSHQMVVR